MWWQTPSIDGANVVAKEGNDFDPLVGSLWHSSAFSYASDVATITVSCNTASWDNGHRQIRAHSLSSSRRQHIASSSNVNDDWPSGKTSQALSTDIHHESLRITIAVRNGNSNIRSAWLASALLTIVVDALKCHPVTAPVGVDGLDGGMELGEEVGDGIITVEIIAMGADGKAGSTGARAMGENGADGAASAQH